MFSAALIFVSLCISYLLVIGTVGLTTYGVAVMSPSLAVSNRRLTLFYNFFQDIVWLAASIVGGFVVTTGAAEASPRMAAAILGLILLFVVWRNMSEARERGMIHMLLTSIFIVAGIYEGYSLHLRHLIPIGTP
ncbi:MAG TPA: hypothetical protein VIM60_04185 [Edaphobacter sp.]